MARAGPANDEERLPWLEPYRETMAHKARIARRSHGGLVAVAGAIAVLFAAGGGYWIGQRDPEPAAPSAEITLAPAAPAPIAAPVEPIAAAPVEAAKAMSAAPARLALAAPHKAAKRSVRQRKMRSPGVELAQHRAVRAAQKHQASLAPLPMVQRAWPKMPSPGPAGQVIQLGAFRHPAGANAAFRMRLARYPMLGSMPRVVVPVITRPGGQILYVLRLGTTSRQQSATVCRNLRASGDHCLVIG